MSDSVTTNTTEMLHLVSHEPVTSPHAAVALLSGAALSPGRRRPSSSAGCRRKELRKWLFWHRHFNQHPLP